MANPDPIIPTSGTEPPSKYLMGLEDDPDAARFDKALQDAFGPQATTDAEEEPETPSDDVPPSDDDGETAPSAGASGEGGEEEGGEDQSQVGAIGDASDFASLFRTRYGHEPSQEEMEGYLALAEWAAGLTPEQQVAVNNALTNPQAYAQSVGSQAQPPSTEPDPLVEEYGEDHPLVQRIRALEAMGQQTVQFTQQQVNQQTVAAINTGSQKFREKYHLEDTDMQILQGAVAKSGLFPGFVQANGGNVDTAIQAALEAQYWQTPEYRQRETDRVIEANKAQQEKDDKRKTKASSVSGTGGNAASRQAPPPKTNEDRWAAVAAGIREAQDNGQQS